MKRCLLWSTCAYFFMQLRSNIVGFWLYPGAVANNPHSLPQTSGMCVHDHQVRYSQATTHIHTALYEAGLLSRTRGGCSPSALQPHLLYTVAL